MAAKPRVVIIDGEIGAGKTTLIELVRKKFVECGLKVAVVPEPVDDWKRVGILQEFYADNPPRYRGLVAYDFQTYTFVTRIQKAIEVVESNPDADVYLLERSVLTDRFVFMELQREMVGEVRMKMYDEWWKMWVRLMPIDLAGGRYVYLKPTLDRCQTRVEIRAREGEVRSDAVSKGEKTADPEASARGGVSYAYQTRLRRAHEAYLEGLHADEFPDVPDRPFDVSKDVIVIDGNLADDDFSAPGAAADQISDFIYKKVTDL